MVRKVREGGWRWKCCWDAETVIQAAERGWHIWVHTHEHCESRRGSWGHWDTGHYTPASVPDQRREAWSDHRGPVTRPRRKPREADGGAGQAGQAWATGVKVVTGEHWGRPEPGWTQWGSAVSSHHQAVAVRVTQDTHPWGACWALTLGHARGHGGGVRGHLLVLVVCWEFIFERSQIEAGYSLIWWLEIQISPILSLNWHKYSNNIQIIHVW